jgi:tetratricopeptide (TPR) repeat protein
MPTLAKGGGRNKRASHKAAQTKIDAGEAGWNDACNLGRLTMKFAIAATAAFAVLAAQSVSAHEVQVVGAGTSQTCIAQAQDPSADLNSAIEGCTEALSYQAMSLSDRAGTLVNRGILRARMSDTKGALDDYNEAISMDATVGAAYLNRCATLLSLKRYGDAKQDADKAIELRAMPLETAYFNRAVAEEGLGDVQSAYADYNAALRIQPGFQPAKDQLTRFKVVRPGSSS